MPSAPESSRSPSLTQSLERASEKAPPSKAQIAALSIIGAIGLTFIALGGASIFGPLNSIGTIISMAGGGVATAISGIGLIWLAI